jgi:hypothetical protein
MTYGTVRHYAGCAGHTDVLLEGRPLAPVLQHVGQALLKAGSTGNEDLVRRCVARKWLALAGYRSHRQMDGNPVRKTTDLHLAD